jgi:hypothetical protein
MLVVLVLEARRPGCPERCLVIKIVVGQLQAIQADRVVLLLPALKLPILDGLRGMLVGHLFIAKKVR